MLHIQSHWKQRNQHDTKCNTSSINLLQLRSKDRKGDTIKWCIKLFFYSIQALMIFCCWIAVKQLLTHWIEFAQLSNNPYLPKTPQFWGWYICCDHQIGILSSNLQFPLKLDIQRFNWAFQHRLFKPGSIREVSAGSCNIHDSAKTCDSCHSHTSPISQSFSWWNHRETFPSG